MQEIAMALGLEPLGLLVLLLVSLVICTTVCTLAMEAAVLFVPAFVFLLPSLAAGFPRLSVNEAIGLAITIEFFGYTSSVLGYWFRRQIDLRAAARLLAVTVPLAVLARMAAYFVPDRGLLLVFGLVLLGLAFVLSREHRPESPRADARTDPGRQDSCASSSGLTLRFLDLLIAGSAGAFAGLVGVAIGEVANTFLTVRKRVPVKVATGTSALVLHVTILSALATNLVVLFADVELFAADSIVIPWTIAFLIAPIVVVGGQLGAFINSRLPDRVLLRALIGAYATIGVFVLGRTVGA